jgi:hypothetical protein
MLAPACGTSSPVSFAVRTRFSSRRPESVEAALLSPVSTAARKTQTEDRRSPSRPQSRRRLSRAGYAALSPSRRSSLVASAARVFGSQVRLAVAPERIPRDTEALREAALQRPGEEDLDSPRSAMTRRPAVASARSPSLSMTSIATMPITANRS